MEKRPFRFSDFLDQQRAGEPRVTPRGDAVVFSSTQPDADRDANIRHLYRVPLAGGPAEPLTTSGTHNGSPAFSPDGRWLAFVSNRQDGNQVWLLPTAGGEARRLTRFPFGARDPVWFPDGRRLLVAASVYPDLEDFSAMEARQKERNGSRSRARIVDGLMFRHWDSWTDDRVDHVFVVDVDTGEARDLTPGPYPAPPRSLSAPPEYAVSPDGGTVCFVSLRSPEQALSTNLHLWLVPATGGEPKRISPRAGTNVFPAFSPDGRSIAYGGMRRAGYESDRLELLRYDLASGETRELCPDFDRSAGPPCWSPCGRWLLFEAQDRGQTRIWRVSSSGGEPEALTGGATDRAPAWTHDGGDIVFVRQAPSAPPEIHRVSSEGGEASPVTALNREVLAPLEMPSFREFWYTGARGEQVHGFLLVPPGFDPDRRYPTVFLIHGGPQGAWGLDFHERWNAQLFASPGFVVVMINPRGSTGYGQAFTDAIHGQWGGDCFEDLKLGVDHVLERYPFCDADRLAAAGASFGGYMVAWMAGQTDRFRCLVCHDGIFNTEMMDYLTDELWFTEWEFEGAPWESPDAYRRWSPHRHVEHMKTPTLVIQGEQDFRCTPAEGYGFFTALQRRGVPSRLIVFPDEGHFVVKPANRELWWREVLGWLRRYLQD